METQHQLILLAEDDRTAPVWSIDERTREIGRRRVAEAREVLRRHRPDGDDAADANHSHAA
jgi:hypothetical protein